MSSSTRYLVSIHDVMPETMGRVAEIFDRLRQAGLLPVTLLVVPGRPWNSASLERLRAMVEQGAELAGHGWAHEVEQLRGLKHRLHSALISKNVAEHLALDTAGCADLMRRCHEWFTEKTLPAPTLYVPPAWAMGTVPRSVLKQMPFNQFETLLGVYESRDRRFHRLPLLGFEVESGWQRLLVQRWNTANFHWGQRFDRPIRLGIHPNDFSLGLSDQLVRIIEFGGVGSRYSEL